MARYGAKASQKVEKSMHEMKRGELKSGRSGKKVTSRKQAIAIGLSEARRAGGKVPAKKSSRKTTSARSSSTRKRGASKSTSTTRKGTSTRKKTSARKRTSSKKS